MQQKNNILKYIGKNTISIVVTILLLLVVFKFYSFDDFLHNLTLIEPFKLLLIFLGGVFFLSASGIELYFYYRIYSNKKINTYDILTMPLVMNLWGHVLPFQGAFIYNAIYLKSKYAISVGSNIKVYLFQFICSIAIGVFMLMAFKINNHSILPIEYILYSVIILLPFIFNKAWWIFLLLLKKFFPARTETENQVYAKLSIQKIFFLFFINLTITLIYCMWIYFIAGILNYNISIVPIIIAGLLSKVALLFRFTPGNIGVNQFAFGGIFVLLGLEAAQGINISLYVSATYFCISFTLGIIFHIINLKFISLNKIFSNTLEE